MGVSHENLSCNHAGLLRQLRQDYPRASFKELCQILQTEHGIEAHYRTLQAALRNIGEVADPVEASQLKREYRADIIQYWEQCETAAGVLERLRDSGVYTNRTEVSQALSDFGFIDIRSYGKTKKLVSNLGDKILALFNEGKSLRGISEALKAEGIIACPTTVRSALIGLGQADALNRRSSRNKGL